MQPTTSTIGQLLIANNQFWAVKFTHSQFTEDIHVINNTEDVTFEGNVYEVLPFVFNPESRGEKGAGNLTISNISQELLDPILEAQQKPNEEIGAHIYLLNVNRDTDTGEFIITSTDFGEYVLNLAELSKEVISATVFLRSSLGYNQGKLRFTPQQFPNLYAT